MGSGHFLIAAIDRIEKRFSEFLATHSLPGVHRELANLRAAAIKELRRQLRVETETEDDQEQDEAEKNKARKDERSASTLPMIEDGQLLRRQIARRCIYGVDMNRWRCSWPASRSGSTALCRACRSRFSTIIWSPATRWSGSARSGISPGMSRIWRPVRH